MCYRAASACDEWKCKRTPNGLLCYHENEELAIVFPESDEKPMKDKYVEMIEAIKDHQMELSIQMTEDLVPVLTIPEREPVTDRLPPPERRTTRLMKNQKSGGN